MRRGYVLIVTIWVVSYLAPSATAQSSVGTTSCSEYRQATSPDQQALYSAYLQAYSDAHSPDPRFTLSDAALAEDAKKVRDWCGKNSKRSYGDAVAAVVTASSSASAPAVTPPTRSYYETTPAGKDRAAEDDLSVGGGSGSCLKAVGAVRANELVRRCLKVSPATHPPCNAENSCSLIRDEIRRGCALIGVGAPSFCEQYRDSVDQ